MSVGHQSPVRAYHAVEMVFVPEQTGNDRLVIGKAHIFGGLSYRYAIIRHDGGRMGFECSFEGNEVIVEVITGIDLSLLEREMRIEAFFLRTAAGKVFCHAGNAVA